MYKSSKPLNPTTHRKKVFEDIVCGTTIIPSDWKQRKSARSKKSVQTQTTDELYNLQEGEVQTGRYTNVYQAQVEINDSSSTLIEYIHKNQYKFTTNIVMNSSKRRYTTSAGSQTIDWAAQIEEGFVTVDCEVETDPQKKIEVENFIEYVDVKKHIGIQTEKQSDIVAAAFEKNNTDEGKSSFASEEGKRGGRGRGAEDEEEEEDGEGKERNNKVASAASAFRDYSSGSRPTSLLKFLEAVTPMVVAAIEENNETNAFDQLLQSLASRNMSHDSFAFLSDSATPETESENGTGGSSSYNKTTIWKCLTVDLEKKKVIFPDWTKAKHVPGLIVKVTTTRNKERIYDIEYEDGGKHVGVREEYLRLLDNYNHTKRGGKGAIDPLGSKRPSASAAANLRLFEGMRVHCRVANKSGVSKYYLGRIVKVQGKSTYDVEILETSRIESGVTADDLIVGGLLEGQSVEARKPIKQFLQSTGVSWNASGSMIGVVYGNNDIYGWCDSPGALCCWNIFNKSFDPLIPDQIIDHSSCLMSISFHPVIPSIVAIGSYNGELLLYDLLHSERPLAISPVIEYSHKEPILEIKWIKSLNTSSTNNLNDLDGWNILTSSSDGKILFWSPIQNKLIFPIKGYLLQGRNSKIDGRKNAGLSSSSISSLVLSCPSYVIGNNTSSGTSSLFNPKWMMVGEANGEILRCQLSRLPNKWISQDTIRSFPTVDEVFPPLNRKEEPFAHQSHIGAVSSMDWSPFHRSLFLTGGVDGKIKLFHILEQQPIFQWEPAAVHQQVFAAGSNSGIIYLYDLSESTKVPIQILEANDKIASSVLHSDFATNPQYSHHNYSNNNNNTNTNTSGSTTGSGLNQRGGHRKPAAAGGGGGISSMFDGSQNNPKNSILGIAFNHKQRDLFAACDWYGKIFIWKLNWSLANRRANEIQLLNDIASQSLLNQNPFPNSNP